MWGFSGLLWWLAAAGFVVLLHLIHLARPRRVEWGAMAFLLRSVQTQRVRIFWEQWLLILLRTLAVVLIVLLFARPLTSHDFPGFWEHSTEQIVLLDDSFSLTERAASGRTLWGEALEKLRGFLQKCSPRDSVTLIRFSRSSEIAQGAPVEFELVRKSVLDVSAGFGFGIAERSSGRVSGERVSGGFGYTEPELPNHHKSTFPNKSSSEKNCSESAATWKAAEAALAHLLLRRSESQKIAVTVFSDFRERDGNAAALNAWKRFLPRGKVRFIPCDFDEATANINLGIERVALVDGVHAAAVEQLLEVVLCCSTHDNASGGNSDAGTLNIFVDDESQIPLAIPPIAAGESLTLRVPIRVAATGGGFGYAEPKLPHDYRVHLELPSDPVAADNHFFGVLTLPPQLAVGVLAASEKSQRAARIISAALAPSGVESGIRVVTLSTELLTHAQTLAPLSLLICLDAGALNLAQVRMLEEFVRGDSVRTGGNLLFFLSEETQVTQFNENFYRDGAGIFPRALANVETLPVDYFSSQSDLSVTSSPIFRVFEAEAQSSRASIKIEKYFSLLNEDRGETLASLRNGAPLVIEKSRNENENSGSVIAFLTSADGTWNSWSRHPSFVVVLHDLVAHLTRRASALAQYQVDAPIRLAADATIFRDALTLSHAENDSRTASISAPFALDRSGFWTLTRTEHSGKNQMQTLGINVDTAEGNLQLAPREDLIMSLRRAGIEWNDTPGETSSRDTPCALILLLVLACLVGETLLARHLTPPSRWA